MTKKGELTKILTALSDSSQTVELHYCMVFSFNQQKP
jgi:hypothetical protein